MSAAQNHAIGSETLASAVDAGEPGVNRDSFAITVSDAAGQVVASASGIITGGNIQSLQMR